MRRTLALGCCAVYLVFGFVAGAAHVHESADHHEDMRGLHLDHAHLDHAHLGEADDHDPAGHHEPASPENGDVRVDARHIGHHDGDALYLTATAFRLLGSGLRVMPATASISGAIDPPALTLIRSDELPAQLRGPPDNSPALPRAPPA